MKITDLLFRRQEESIWRKNFMEQAIRSGLSFDSAEKLSKSKRAEELKGIGISGREAYEIFESKNHAKKSN